MTTTTAPKFRKTKNDKWVAYGPTTVVKPGAVEVVKADGTRKLVTVTELGKPFMVDGVKCVYGYLADDKPRTAHAAISSQPRRAWYDNPNHQCWSCRCHEHGAPFDGCDRCFCDGDV
jgi:hypothetical protein